MKTRYIVKDKIVFPDEILSMSKIDCDNGFSGIFIHYLSDAKQILSFTSSIDRDIIYSFIWDKAKENANEI